MTEVSGGADWPDGGPNRGPSGRPSDRLDLGRSPWRGAIKAAGRHSARVRFLRRAILAGAVIAIAVISGVVLFDPFRRLPHNISIGQVRLDGSRVTVESPKISGFQKDGRPYEVKARSGSQDITTPNIVELLDIDATIGIADASMARVTAARGVYDSLHDNIILQGDARIRNEIGYDILMKTAQMDFKTGALVSKEPVSVILKGGTIAANEMNISDNGDRISFEGAVKSMIETAASEMGALGAPAAVTEK